MRIALVNSFPNKPQTAEKEFILRALLALNKLGWQGREVVTSNEIHEFAPDCVLVLHEFTPKLTPFPTIGMLWSPLDFYINDAQRLKNILSWDGYMYGSSRPTEFIEDYMFSLHKTAAVADFLFFPSCQETPFAGDAFKRGQELSLFYAGVHWDGERHAKLSRELSRRLPLKLYGPPQAWTHLSKLYQGQIPFDGRSVVDTIRQSGVALCLHKFEHFFSNLPSMRLFEAAAASAIIISDELPIAQQMFGDAIFYVDHTRPALEVAHHIEAHFKRIKANPEMALDMAQRAHTLFRDNFCLERQFAKLPAFLDKVRAIGGFTRAPFVSTTRPTEYPAVEYIIRIGSRPVTLIERALRALKNQTYPRVGVLLVQFAPVIGLEELIARYQEFFVSIKVIPSPATGNRSTELWDGMRNVTAPYFGNLDDDDELHPNHVTEVMKLLLATPDASFCYSGTVQVQEEPGHDYHQPNFDGPDKTVIHENRQLIFLDGPENFLLVDNFINSNSWIAAQSLLDDHLLLDPKLRVAEDVYLYRLFYLCKTRFVTTYRPTAVWNWRSESRDNSMLKEGQKCFRQCGDRIYKRLANVPLPTYAFTHELLRVMTRLYQIHQMAAPVLRPLRPLARALRTGLSRLAKIRLHVPKIARRKERPKTADEVRKKAA